MSTSHLKNQFTEIFKNLPIILTQAKNAITGSCNFIKNNYLKLYYCNFQLLLKGPSFPVRMGPQNFTFANCWSRTLYTQWPSAVNQQLTAATRMSCSSGRRSSSSTAACQVMGVIDLLFFRNGRIPEEEVNQQCQRTEGFNSSEHHTNVSRHFKYIIICIVQVQSKVQSKQTPTTLLHQEAEGPLVG